MLLSLPTAFKEEQFLTMGELVQPAPAGRRVHYERWRAEDTVLYQLVQEHLETFLAQVERETGAGLPEFVKEELDALLDCGILASGFLRLRCADCAHEKLVAFSCKRRGFCPSCGAWRMAETAAHLIDHVIPRVPVRQWCSRFRSRFACCSLHIRSPSAPVRLSFAQVLKRVFDIDIAQCPQCGGTLTIIAAIEDPAVIAKDLTHLGLSARAPSRSPARSFDRLEMP